MISGAVKGFGCTFDYALYDISFNNLLLYSATIPSYESLKDKKNGKNEEVIKADDPRNRNKVREFLNLQT